MGKRLIDIGKERLPLLLFGGVSLASLALMIFFGQAFRQLLSPEPATRDSQKQQQTSTKVFQLALQSPEIRRDMLQQLIDLGGNSDAYLARYLLGTDLLSQGQAAAALSVLGAMLENVDEQTVLSPYVLLKQGQAQLLAGESPTSWDQLLTDYATHSATAEARYELGKREPAQWEALLAKHPSHPRAVEIALQQLKTGTSKDNLLLVATHGLYREEYEASLDRLTKEYGQQLTPEQWETVGFGYWENLRYGKASEAYAKAPTSPTSLYRTARGAQIAKKRVVAIAAYQKLAKTYPNAPETGLGLIKLVDSLPDKAALAPLDQVMQTFPERAGEALLKKANILEQLNSPTSAKDARTSVLSQYSNSDAAAELRLSRAHRAAKANDLSTARQLAEDLVKANPQSELAAEASFWSGKWAQGQESAARQAYERTLSKYPESYFAWRSAVMLGWDVGDFNSVRYLTPEVNLPRQRDVLPAGSETLKLLYRLGQDADAWSLWQTEFENVQTPTVGEQFTDGVMRVGVGDNLDGIFMLTSLAWRDEQAEQSEYQQLRTTSNYWQTVYPFPFSDLIQLWSQQRQLNPLLVTALMRQESRFEPKIRSIAGAVGLMQVIPSTADWILGQIGESTESLNVTLQTPNENIKLGTWYLDYTHQEYSDNSMFAVASYNAGPGAVADWIARGYGDPDVFVDNIPFSETKGYVEAVFGGYWNYLRLYNPAIRRQMAQYSDQ